MSKPRICEVLQVEVDEEFRIRGYNNYYRVNKSGNFQTKVGDNDYIDNPSFCLNDIINHPEKILRKSRWTETDIKLAEAIRTLSPDATKISKVYYAYDRTTIVAGTLSIYDDIFPALNLGEIVRIDEILESKNE